MRLKRETPVKAGSNGHVPHGTKAVHLSNGMTLYVKRVSPMLMAEAYRATPTPEPPRQTVDTLEGVREVENTSHPDYQIALKMHEADLQVAKLRLMLKYGAVLELDEQMDAELDELLADLSEQGKGLPWVKSVKDRRAAYIMYLMLTTLEDYQAIGEAIAAISGPSGEAIAAARATFPPDVQGA